MARVCVITFSVDRPRCLARCIESVLSQTYSQPLIHRVFSEKVEELTASSELKGLHQRVVWHSLPGEPHIGVPSPRMSLLRSMSLQYVREPFCCFLDDDNRMLPHHLTSLMTLLQSFGLDAAHSWRTVVEPNGELFRGDYYPWHHDACKAEAMYQWCVRYGVMVPGEPVVRDGLRGPEGPDNISTVDMNEWLFRTVFIKKLGFNHHFSQQEIADHVGEDDKLFTRIKQQAIRFACSELATVEYTLGGVSNRPALACSDHHDSKTNRSDAIG